jgi:hypothetical protein
MHCEHTLLFHNTIRLCVWCWHPYSFHWQGMNGLTSGLVFHIRDSQKFSGLLTVWVCATIGMSVTHCLPVDNTQCQPTTAVINTHVAPQMAQICLQISAGWHPSAPKNWILTFWSNLDSSNPWYTVFESYCTVVHPVPCIVLHKCLSTCLPS